MDYAADDRYGQPHDGDDLDMDLPEYTHIIREIEQQPRWRARADKEMDYADGNQLDSELMR